MRTALAASPEIEKAKDLTEGPQFIDRSNLHIGPLTALGATDCSWG